MEERYAVLLKGRKIGTVRLDPARRGTVTTRMAPLPAFRGVARYRRTLKTAQDDGLMEERRPSAADLAAAEGAEAVLGALRLSLAQDPDGAPVSTENVRLLDGEPPSLRVTW